MVIKAKSLRVSQKNTLSRAFGTAVFHLAQSYPLNVNYLNLLVLLVQRYVKCFSVLRETVG